jgi:hypothetical protein
MEKTKDCLLSLLWSSEGVALKLDEKGSDYVFFSPDGSPRKTRDTISKFEEPCSKPFTVHSENPLGPPNY